MKIYKRTSLLFFVSLSVAGLTALGAFQLKGQSGHDEGVPDKQKQKSDFEAQFPVTDYDAPQPIDHEKQKKRRVISKKYDKADTPISEEADTIFSAVDWEAGLPALPVAQSQLIILGEVLDAQAYLSEDKTAVYSEFKIRIDSVPKDDAASGVAPGAILFAQRSGGRVRFRSGHVVLQHTRGQGLPRVGRRYALLLTGAQDQNFGILTGYELKAGRVALLDNPGGGTHAISKYGGVSEEEFLRQLQLAIAANKTPSSNRARSLKFVSRAR